MGIKAWFKRGDQIKEMVYTASLAAEMAYQNFILQACVKMISEIFARAEFATYISGKEQKKDNYYLFNIRPNKNQSATEFWKVAISRLLNNNEVLIIQQSDELFIADGFTAKEYVLFDTIYSDVIVGDLNFGRAFTANEVFHWKLSDQNMSMQFTLIAEKYSRLMASATNSFNRSNARRATLKLDTTYSQSKDKYAELKKTIETNYSQFLKTENAAILPVAEGLEYSEKDLTPAVKTDTRDITHLFNDILGFAALAFGIPRGLFNDTVVDTEKLIKALLIFCISPLAELIADEINGKFYSKSQYLSGNYVRIKTERIEATDIVSVATGADVLFRIGFSVNDILRQLGLETISEPWADEHYVTNNYSNVVKRGGDQNAN